MRDRERKKDCSLSGNNTLVFYNLKKSPEGFRNGRFPVVHKWLLYINHIQMYKEGDKDKESYI